MMKVLVPSAALALALWGSASIARNERVDPVAVGQRVYEQNCLACHGPGPGYPPMAELPGTEALRAKYKGEMPALLSERADLTPEIVAYFVRNGVSVMPFYRKTEISDAELAALGAYLSRNNPEMKKAKKK